MSNYRIIPKALHSTRPHWGLFPVVRVEAIPPEGRKPGDAPIYQHLTLVRCTLQGGSIRHFGYERAWIGSDLRTHVGPINLQDEVQVTWDVSEGNAT